MGVATMPETERICQQMQQAIYGEAWHGPCLADVLQGVTLDAAVLKVGGMHSIWELLGHLTATQSVILDRIQTGSDTGVEWLEIPAVTEASWQQAWANFQRAESSLRQAIAAFPRERLTAPLKQGGTSPYNNFHGNVQHIAYHTAQIAMLRKLAALNET